MKAVAFAPGHISGFFEPIYNKNIEKTGSRGAGININLGVLSEVTIKDSKDQIFDFYINNTKTDSPLIKCALKNLIGEKALHIIVKTQLELPISQGFGMSAASAVSTTYALSKIINLSYKDALRAAHIAEVKLQTGLGDAIACCFGGIEIRRKPGIPPWGCIEHIPGNFDLVLCVVDNKINTKNILCNKNKIKNITYYGRNCTNRIIKSPTVNNFFFLSKFFIKNTNLASKRVVEAIDAANEYGTASMCMLGNSIFAIGKTEKLCKKLDAFGKVFVCTINKTGARIIND